MQILITHYRCHSMKQPTIIYLQHIQINPLEDPFNIHQLGNCMIINSFSDEQDGNCEYVRKRSPHYRPLPPNEVCDGDEVKC